MAPTFTLAQLMLRRLLPAITATKNTIRRGVDGNTCHDPPTIEQMTDVNMSDSFFTLFDGFEHSSNNMLETHDRGFWADGSVDIFDVDLGINAIDDHILGGGIISLSEWHPSAPIL